MLQDILDEAVDLHLGILGLREIQSSKFMRVFKGLLTSNWALGFPKYTTGFQSHALVFIIFSGCATLELAKAVDGMEILHSRYPHARQRGEVVNLLDVRDCFSHFRRIQN